MCKLVIFYNFFKPFSTIYNRNCLKFTDNLNYLSTVFAVNRQKKKCLNELSFLLILFGSISNTYPCHKFHLKTNFEFKMQKAFFQHYYYLEIFFLKILTFLFVIFEKLTSFYSPTFS